MAALPIPAARYERAEVIDTIKQTVAKGAAEIVRVALQAHGPAVGRPTRDDARGPYPCFAMHRTS